MINTSRLNKSEAEGSDLTFRNTTDEKYTYFKVKTSKGWILNHQHKNVLNSLKI